MNARKLLTGLFLIAGFAMTGCHTCQVCDNIGGPCGLYNRVADIAASEGVSGGTVIHSAPTTAPMPITTPSPSARLDRAGNPVR